VTETATWSVTEIVSARRQVGDPPNRRAIREFRAYSKEGTELAPEQADWLLENILNPPVRPDDPHPNLPGYRATFWPDMQPVPGQNNHATITVYYEPDPELEIGAGAALQQTVDHSAQFVLVWRSNPDVTVAGANYNFPNRLTTGHDIGGTPIDSRGTPNSYPVSRAVIQVTQRLNSPKDEVYRELVNTRNDRSFLGVDAGKLLFVGARSYQSSSSAVATVVRGPAEAEHRRGVRIAQRHVLPAGDGGVPRLVVSAVSEPGEFRAAEDPDLEGDHADGQRRQNGVR
jgi:hypothetical protein